MASPHTDVFGLVERYIKEYVPRSAGYLHPDEVRNILDAVLRTHPFCLTPADKDDIVRYFANGMPKLKGE